MGKANTGMAISMTDWLIRNKCTILFKKTLARAPFEFKIIFHKHFNSKETYTILSASLQALKSVTLSHIDNKNSKKKDQTW